MPKRSDGEENQLSAGAARELLRQARAARANAYAPYSHFPVGAALLARDGRVFTGVNVENASYGLTTCAERTAVVSALATGAREFVAVAVTGPDDRHPCPPCGSCRQILHEVAPGLVVVTAGEDGEPATASLRDLLPGAFDGTTVRREGAGS
jgi:cytidine deaminase